MAEDQPLPSSFVADLEFVSLKDLTEKYLDPNRKPAAGTQWVITNEVKPSDIYCYLGARFGQPNGMQNFLRKDDSDNLVHWEWCLKSPVGFVTIAGLNFRTDVWISNSKFAEAEINSFVQQIKRDFSRYSKQMGHIRSQLEPWIEFVNPYQRLRRAIKQLLEELDALGLDPQADSMPSLIDSEDLTAQSKLWKSRASDYSRAIGLSFGIRSMVPVAAEAFVNLILFALAKPSVRQDKALYDGIFRLPMHIRVASLPHYCNGFSAPVASEHKAVSEYFGLISKRNDLLHGNISIDKLKFNELFFLGTVPIFNRYSTMWERSLGVAHRAVGMEEVRSELVIVDALVSYLLSLLHEKYRTEMTTISDKFDLGIRKDTGRLGVLFGEVLVDFGPMKARNKPGGTTFHLGMVTDAPPSEEASATDDVDSQRDESIPE